jgi:hypothetical protein
MLAPSCGRAVGGRVDVHEPHDHRGKREREGDERIQKDKDRVEGMSRHGPALYAALTG